MPDGLSIPFFNLGQNVSRNVTLTTTLTSRSRSYPDWIFNINRVAATPQESALQINVEAASPVTPHIDQNDVVHETVTASSIQQQEHVYTDQNDVIHDTATEPLQILDIEASCIVERRVVNVTTDETE